MPSEDFTTTLRGDLVAHPQVIALVKQAFPESAYRFGSDSRLSKSVILLNFSTWLSMEVQDFYAAFDQNYRIIPS